jgi:hypothetical protein
VVVEPEVAVAGQVPDDLLDHREGGAETLVVAGALGQVREHAPQVDAGVPDPVGFGPGAEQDLRDGETDQLGVGQPWWSASPPGARIVSSILT